MRAMPLRPQSAFTSNHFVRNSEAASESPATCGSAASVTHGPVSYLHLSDTKTRARQDLPSENDAFPARMQLMIYRRLLVQMFSSSFRWSALWAKLGIDPSQPLDEDFRSQVCRVLSPCLLDSATGEGSRRSMRTIRDCVEVLRSTLQSLGVAGIHHQLTLVYRSQTSGRAPREDVVRDASLLQASLEAELLQEDGAVPELARLVAADMVEQGLTRVSRGESFVNLTGIPHGLMIELVDDGDGDSANDIAESPIIGVKTFDMDDTLLDTHLSRVLAWWMGERPPEGVSIENTRRCG